MIPIFDTTLKGKKQVKKYMRALHHESVLFLQSRNLFFYVPDNEIEGDILGWTTSYMLAVLMSLFGVHLLLDLDLWYIW